MLKIPRSAKYLSSVSVFISDIGKMRAQVEQIRTVRTHLEPATAVFTPNFTKIDGTELAIAIR